MRLSLLFFILLFSFEQYGFSKNLEEQFPNGLDQESLTQFLVKIYLPTLPEDINPQDCFKVKELDWGGYSTEKLFQATMQSRCTLNEQSKNLIIKEVNPKNTFELEHLKAVKESNFFSILPNDIRLILPEYSFTFTLKNSESNEKEVLEENFDYSVTGYFKTEKLAPKKPHKGPIRFEIMEMAPGYEMSKIFQENYPNVDSPENLLAVKAYAKALSTLHQTFMDEDTIPKSIIEIQNAPDELIDKYKTIIHQDAHWANLFYDPKTGITSFIDNEGFASSLIKKKSIISDLYRVSFYSTSSFTNCAESNYDAAKCTYGIDVADKIIKEYISHYPQKNQEILMAFLKKYLMRLSINNTMNLKGKAVKKWQDKIVALGR